jgi:stage III sporulation protein AH
MNRKTRWALGTALLAALLAADTLITQRLVLQKVNRAQSAPAYSQVQSDPMTAFRLEREQLRSRQEAQLNDIIHSPDGDGEIVGLARKQLLDMLEHARQESTLEGILQSRGFEDALVSVSGAGANVMLRGEEVTAAQSAVILDLVMRETGLTGGNVKIIPVK